MSKASKSKQDVLKRYLSSSTSDANDVMKKKTKRRKTDASLTGGVRVVDADEAWRASADAQERWLDDDEKDDDRPLVVDDKGDVVSLNKDEGKNGERDSSPPRRRPLADASPPRRKRHDSPDASPPRRRQADASPPRRKRHDSPENDASPPRRKRHGSPDADASPPRRKRHDSPSPEPKRRRHDSPKEVGLKTGAEFRKELEAKKAKEQEVWSQLQKADFSGENADTVIRDRRGRKLEALSEFMTQQAVAEGRAKREEKEQYEWGKGKVQKEERDAFKRELEDIKNQPFARYENDPRLDEARKATIHADDPMAQYFANKVKKERAAMGLPEKLVYKGPPPKPNRFNLLPGYRWDGIDRGNGFEQRWFKRQAQMINDKRRADQWEASDL